MAVPEKIHQLIETFDRNIETYKNQHYHETELRHEFIDPFFIALGWDVNNTQGTAPAYKDVIHEDSIKIGSSTKAPDYCFRIGPKRIFFLEAKKPSVDIKGDVGPAYQLRRYAWSAKLPLSILTDFEEFAVYDCRIRPNVNDKPSTARILFFNYKDYADKWDQIADIFSKDAVRKGSFDKYALETKGKRGTTTVDKEFLSEIESWREMLAKNIALRNDSLTNRQLNYSVQLTIDRILFLRMCEDNGIEPAEQLSNLTDNAKIYKRLYQVFQKADDKYNSGLFHFTQEKGRSEPPDDLTPNLDIDDKPLAQIIKSLYYPHSPYVFSVLPAEILGNVYEQFLGKVIRLTASHQAKVEEKPEVKKAGGVYYTPAYIVDYIVKNTVGKLCENKIPKQISKLKILDPACGSGSFLIGAYKYLLDFHRDFYEKEPSKHKKAIYQGKGGQWYLTIAEKKRILLNNVFGVDIDSQAVEVTKLSLLLKVLENETQETLGQTLKLFHERALPDLAENIKCGNSLIAPDFYQNQQLGLFGDEEKYKINAFPWQTEFPEIFKQGGFDCVIGNPPYGAEFSYDVKHFLSKKYEVSVPITDSFVLFILKAFDLTKAGGLQAFIVPSTWLYMPSYLEFRKQLLKDCTIEQIVHFRKPVFGKATVETCIEIMRNQGSKETVIQFLEVASNPALFVGEKQEIQQKKVLNEEFSNLCNNRSRQAQELFLRIQQRYAKLDQISKIVCGLTPYRKGKGNPPQTQDIVDRRAFDSDRKIDGTYRLYIMGRDFFRYSWQIQEKRWISYGDWLAEPRYKAPFDSNPKIVVRQTADSIIAQIDTNKFLSLKNVHNLRIDSNQITYFYLLGLLNSRLITWWYRCLIPETGRVFAEVKVVNLKKLPIRTIDFSNQSDKPKHDKMVLLVEQMLYLQKKLTTAKTPDEKTRLQRQIDSTDTQIDKLVYELYDLTPEEIKIVEGRTHNA